jgi:4-amino-4-deoxy-L-arabinose transferase-like glycosyltransferase
VVAGGVALRAVNALALAPPVELFGDGWFFHEVGRLVAEGEGYVRPAPFIFEGERIATAEHPPLFTLAVAALAKLGVGGEEAQRVLLGSLFGGAVIAVLGLVGRRLGGDRCGLLAAGIAAAYPTLIAADGALLGETLYGLLLALALLAALQLAEQAQARWALALGVLLGLAALTRSEALLLLVLLGAPAAWAAAAWRRRLGLLALAWVGALIVIAPWFGRNLAEFDRPVLISTNDGTTLAGSNCDATYRGERMGSFRTSCIPRIAEGDESRRSAELRARAREYAQNHAGRLPLVVAARVGRVLGLYRPLQTAEDNEGRRRVVQLAGVITFYPLAALALAGALALRRRRRELALLLAPALMALAVAACVHGSVRLRHAAEIGIVLLAAVWLAQRGAPEARPRTAAAPGAREGASART